jgi:hypothetical protein
VTHPGRTVTVRERGVRRGIVGLTPRPLNIADGQFPIADWNSYQACVFAFLMFASSMLLINEINRQSAIKNRQ